MDSSIPIDFKNFTLDSFIEILKTFLDNLYNILWVNKEEK